MNCEQFENRIQQQLDERVELSLDLQLQRHARRCDHCAYKLALYECIAVDSQGCGDVNSQVVHPLASRDQWLASPGTPRPRIRSHETLSRDRMAGDRARVNAPRRRLPRYLGIAVAALVLTVILPWTADSPQRFNSDMRSLDHQSSELLSGAERPIIQQFANSIDIPKWFTENVSANLTNVASQIDLSGIGQVDLVALMPKEPMYAVQMLPVALQQIEPIYRYSNEIPGVNRWSSGINYTFGLIWVKIPGQNKDERPDNDENWRELGERIYFKLRQIC